MTLVSVKGLGICCTLRVTPPEPLPVKQSQADKAIHMSFQVKR